MAQSTDTPLTSKQRCVVIPLDVNRPAPLEILLREQRVTFWVCDLAVVREPIYRLADETERDRG